MKSSRLCVLGFVVVLIALFVCACGSDDGGSKNDGLACSQASECGPREAWVCEDNVCYNRAEFCRDDSECKGNCNNHKCSEGRIQTVSTFCINMCSEVLGCSESASWPSGCIDACAAFAQYIQNLDDVWSCMSVLECDAYGDIENARQVLNKGCNPLYPEGYDPDAPDGDGGDCEFDCCSDSDCPPQFSCNLEQHICVYSPNCQYECCSDSDCHDNPAFGSAYICKFRECYNPSQPCPWDCCSDSDCSYNEVCEMGDCNKKEVLCSPGERKCCSADSQHPDCVGFGDKAAESYLVCNSTGNLWQGESCPSFNNCVSNPPNDIACVPNGGCETDDDCSSPLTCRDGDNGKRCSLPLLDAGDKCWDGSRYLGDCPDNYSCCPITTENPGYCVAEEC